MNITSKMIGANFFEVIKAKISAILTPLQLKIALIAAAIFAGAMIGYLMFKCFHSRFSKKSPSQIEPVPLKEKQIPKEVLIVPEKALPVQPIIEKKVEEPSVIQPPQPVKKHLTVQEKLEKNRKFAAEYEPSGLWERLSFRISKRFNIVEIPLDASLTIDEIGQNLSLKIKGRDKYDPPIEVSIRGIEKKIGDTLIGCGKCIGRRPTMEDEARATDGKIQIKDKSYSFQLYGVFDGHKGDGASYFVRINLDKYLIQELESHCKEGLTDEGIYRALKDCYIKLDKDYPNEDGTTATSILILEGKIWIFSVGDSRAIIVKDGQATQASEDAKPYIERYRKKIEKHGGTIDGDRVKDDLAMATAIGDNEPSLKTCILPNPKITCYPDDYDYLVLATDGLWDVASTKAVGDCIQKMHAMHLPPVEMAKRLVYSAMEGHPSSNDNVTVLVIKR